MPVVLIQVRASQLPAVVRRHLRESVLKTEGTRVSMNDWLILLLWNYDGTTRGTETASKAEGGGDSDPKSFSKPHLLTDLSPPSSTNLRTILLKMDFGGQSRSKLQHSPRPTPPPHTP